MSERRGPPYDDKPCPMCLMELRNLAAVAHNIVTAWKAGNTNRVLAKMPDLAAALEPVQALSDEHFKDPAHAFPPDAMARSRDLAAGYWLRGCAGTVRSTDDDPV